MIFKDFIHRLFSALLQRKQIRLESLETSTLLTRFILDRKHLRKTKPFVKAKTFLPREDPSIGLLALSTFRIDRLEEDEIWEIGKREIVPRARRSIKGRCDLTVEIYKNQGLQTIFDNDPLRHVNIIGWPEREDERLSIAQELAATVTERDSFYSLID